MPKEIHQSVLSLIGKTPLVQLHGCLPKTHHRFFAKMEYLNPGGSVKDRMAKAIIEQAEKRGDLKAGGTIIEATSGNTGVGLAMVAAVKGYKCIIAIPSKMSAEKVDMLKAFGAEVIITPSGVEPDDPRSHYSVAKKLKSEIPNSFATDQWNNEDNPNVHVQTTGPEIWEQTGGEVDAFVAGAGTGGTISGVGRFLKSKSSAIQIVCADPVGSILYDLFYHKEVRTPPAPYLMEGIGEDMMPKNVHFDVIDHFIKVEDKETFALCRKILAKDGIFVGPSSAAALMAGIKYSEKIEKPQNIVVVFPDQGSRYLSKVFNEKWMKEQGLL